MMRKWARTDVDMAGYCFGNGWLSGCACSGEVGEVMAAVAVVSARDGVVGAVLVGALERREGDAERRRPCEKERGGRGGVAAHADGGAGGLDEGGGGLLDCHGDGGGGDGAVAEVGVAQLAERVHPRDGGVENV